MRLLRAEKGWSQEYLAAEAGLNRTYLSAVERSEQNISLDNIYKISMALQVDAGALLTKAQIHKGGYRGGLAKP